MEEETEEEKVVGEVGGWWCSTEAGPARGLRGYVT